MRTWVPLWAACGVMCYTQVLLGGSAVVTIYPKQEIGAVNRLLFGSNQLAYQDSQDEYGNRGSGIWDPEKRRSVPEYVALAKLSGLSVSRWPGGCGAHAYNWKRTVGAVVDRQTQAFGLPEFLRWCGDTDSLPLITLPVYWGTPDDAADLVEYLNSPNDGSNPNGGRDWAALRAADGHAPPYDVVWFEFGNETYHGMHAGKLPRQRIVAEEYVERYRATRTAMKAIDPRIRLGAVLQHDEKHWTASILEALRRDIDFGIDHTYLPVWGKDAGPEESRILLQAATACGAQLQEIYEQLNQETQDLAERNDLTWAITEYNGHYVQDRPVPYRQTLANALRNAEHMRIMMNPKNRIAMANFWQFANEYWGMVRGYVDRREPLQKQANYLVYELYAQHFGTTLVRSRVTCDTWDFPGGAGVRPRLGTPSPLMLDPEDLLPATARWTIEPLAGVRQQARNPQLLVEFQDRDVNYYHARLTLPARPNTWYRVTGLIRTEALDSNRGACLQVGDARGWEVTHSCAISNDVVGTSEWREVKVDYRTLSDTEAIAIMARRMGKEENEKPDNASGKAVYRVYSVHTFQPGNLGAVPDVTANTATRANGTVTAILVNTNFDRDNDVEIDLAGVTPRPLSTAKAWLLSGQSPWSTNLGRTPMVRVSLPTVRATQTGWVVPLPRHAMVAVEITP